MPTEDYGVRFTAQDLTRKAATSAVKSIGKVVAQYAGMAAGVVGVTVVTRKAIATIGQAVTAANDQSVANAKVTAALKQTGQWSQETEDRLFSYATELQNTLGIADDLTLSQNALALGMGATAESLPKISEALANVAAAGLPAESILRGLVSAMTSGDAAMLSRYIPAVRTLTKEQLMQGAATDMLLESFGGLAAAQAGTFKGSVDILTAAYGDFLEQVGFVITKSPIAKAAIQEITKAIIAQSKAINDNTDAYITLVDEGVIYLIGASAKLVHITGRITASVLEARVAYTALWETILGAAGAVTSVLSKIEEIGARNIVSGRDFAEEGETHWASITRSIREYQSAFAETSTDYSDRAALMRANTDEAVTSMGRHKAAILATAEAWRVSQAKADKLSGVEGGGGFRGLTEEADKAKKSIEDLAEEALKAEIQSLEEAIRMVEEQQRGINALGLSAREAGEAATFLSGEITRMSNRLSFLRGELEGVDDELDRMLDAFTVAGEAGGRVFNPVLGALVQLRIGLDAAALSLEEINLLYEKTANSNIRMEQGLKSGSDAWLEWGEQTKNVAFDVNNVMVNTLQSGINSTFSSLGNAVRSSLGPIEDMGDAWKAVVGTIADMAAQITATIVSAALAQGLANAVPIAGSAAVAAGPAAPIVFGAVLATVAATVVAAIAEAQSAQSQIGAAEGGFVVGPGPRGVDSVPAVLAPGEVVLPDDVVAVVRAAGQIVSGGALDRGGSSPTFITQSLVPDSPYEFERRVERVMRRLFNDMRARRAF